MRRTTLGKTGIETSALGFGCSGLMGSGTQVERMALLHHALDCGVTHFDVARMYGLGQAEAELGRFVRENRTKVTVATKFGIDPMPLATAGLSRVLGKLGAGSVSRRLEASHARRRTHLFSVGDARSALESSLKKLGVETIDLLLLHDCAPSDVRTTELAEFLSEARREGKIRAFGLATDIGAILEIARTQPGLAEVVQFENSALSPAIGRLPPNHERVIITHRALSGSLTDLREWLGARPETARAWSAELGADLAEPNTLAKAMLAYAASANPNGVVLFSTTRRDRIDTNVRALNEPVLPPDRAIRLAELAAERTI